MFKTSSLKVLTLSLLCLNVNAQPDGETRVPGPNAGLIPLQCVPKDLAVAPTKTVYTNEIDPIKEALVNGQKACVKDECGTTCFSGNAAVTPLREFRVNNMSAVKLNDKKQCIPDRQGTICVHSTLAIDPEVRNSKLLVNEINPVKVVKTTELDPCTNKPTERCVEDERCEACTHFSGNVCIRDKRILGQIDNISLSTSQNVAVIKLELDQHDLTNQDFLLRKAPAVCIKICTQGWVECRGVGQLSQFDIFHSTELWITPLGCYCHLAPDITLSCVNNNVVKIISTVCADVNNPNLIYIYLTLIPVNQQDQNSYLCNCNFWFDLCAGHLKDIQCLPVPAEVRQLNDICQPN